MDVNIMRLFDIVQSEMDFGHEKFGRFHNSHELSAVLHEEVEEYWEYVRGDSSGTPHALYELCQVAAVALRYVVENGDVVEIGKAQKNRHRR